MGDPRKHHYVPVFYQKYFTNPNGLLFVYDRQTQTYNELHPRSVCVGTDLYAIRYTDGRPRDRRIESILSDADGKSAVAIRDLTPPRQPRPETQAALAIFAALQYLRVPTNDTLIRAMYETGASDLMEVTFSNVTRAKAALSRYEKDTGKPLGASAESMVEAVKGHRVKPVATEIPFLMMLGKQTGKFAQDLSQLKLQILISPAATGFILTDNPFTTVPARGDDRLGIVNFGTFSYIPATRNICLRYGIAGRTGFRQLEREDVRIINQNLAVNSERFIFGPNETQLESVVRRSGSAEIDGNPRFEFDKTTNDDGGILRKLTRLPRRRYFY